MNFIGRDFPAILLHVLRVPLVGPLAALALALVFFGVTGTGFFDPDNVSLILQQSVVVGILAAAQTLIILTAGIDLSIGAIAVLATVVMGKYAGVSGELLAMVLALVSSTMLGTINGSLVTVLRLPPFIVTLGVFTVVQASTLLLAGSQTFPIHDGLLTFLGRSFQIIDFSTTYGVMALFLVYGVIWYALTQTAWGKHVYAIGGNINAARLAGIHTQGNLLSVYVVSGIIAAIAAWAALGRIPNADPNAYQLANLDSITAVVIGGTSLFGGRGSVLGTLIGTLIVSVLRNGLTLAGVDSLYQNIATGVLVILAVTVDQFSRQKSA